MQPSGYRVYPGQRGEHYWETETYTANVNGRTGEVQGERPWSWIKITFAVLLSAAAIGGMYFATQQ